MRTNEKLTRQRDSGDMRKPIMAVVSLALVTLAASRAGAQTEPGSRSVRQPEHSSSSSASALTADYRTHSSREVRSNVT
jgi:hypothetical protein